MPHIGNSVTHDYRVIVFIFCVWVLIYNLMILTWRLLGKAFAYVLLRHRQTLIVFTKKYLKVTD